MEAGNWPNGFVWGVSSSAFQIEGALAQDGRGESIWDVFTRRDGAVRDGQTAETACDHYHRMPEDVALLAGLGLDAYRFSIAWPRVVPDGTGPVNAAGLDFYDRLVDALGEHGITPVPTLYHWDLPQPLEDAGGWLNRDTAARFADYAAAVADRLGDRIGTWITLNEPFEHMAGGYAFGTHAPGRFLLLDALPVAHHQLLAHALAAPRLPGEVLLTNSYSPAWGDPAGAAAYDALQNRLFTDPLLLGAYPDLSAFGITELPFVADGDLAVIHGSADAIGVNYYNPTLLTAPGEGAGLPFDIADIEGYPVTAFGWPVVPDGLREMIATLRSRYGSALPPLYITENGCSSDQTPDDTERVTYLDGHLRALGEAIADGADVRGYFVWTLTDNFEWAEGYHQRFGLVHVDHATQKRTPRASYAWYRDVIKAARG